MPETKEITVNVDLKVNLDEANRGVAQALRDAANARLRELAPDRSETVLHIGGPAHGRFEFVPNSRLQKIVYEADTAAFSRQAYIRDNLPSIGATFSTKRHVYQPTDILIGDIRVLLHEDHTPPAAKNLRRAHDELPGVIADRDAAEKRASQYLIERDAVQKTASIMQERAQRAERRAERAEDQLRAVREALDAADDAVASAVKAACPDVDFLSRPA